MLQQAGYFLCPSFLITFLLVYCTVLQEAVDIVQRHLHRGYHEACQELIETAAARWQEEEGDYRDDVSLLFIISVSRYKNK